MNTNKHELVIRIIDVNFNRAREATRVIEDYTRFVLDNEPLTAALRNIRHKLTTLLKPILSDRTLLAARNVPDDIGRESVSHTSIISEIIIANFKRLQESLRSIAEYLKTAPSPYPLPSRERDRVRGEIVTEIEKLRFTAYELEQQLSVHLFPKKAFANVRLYVLVGGDLVRQALPEVVRQVIRGGADAVQLREKSMPDKVLLDIAREIRRVTLAHKILFIVNDRVDIALLANADGVHLGKDDIPIRQARKILGTDKVIGATTHNIKEALAVQEEGADYISVGPMFTSPTKPNLAAGGLNYLKEVARKIRIPYVAIGGINKTTLPHLVKRHRKWFDYPLKAAICSGVIAQPNPTAAARVIKRGLLEGNNKHESHE